MRAISLWTARASWSSGRQASACNLAARRSRPSFAAQIQDPQLRCFRCSVRWTTAANLARSISSAPSIFSKNERKGHSEEPSAALDNSHRSESAPSAAAAAPGELPSTAEGRRSAMSHKLGHFMDSLQARVLTASHTLNDLTGYSAIESIKAANENLEARLAEAEARVRTARQAYKASNTKRATTQREVTTLLARKDSWSPVDLECFTALYKTDHELEGEVGTAQEALTEAESEQQNLSQRLNAGILKRYHEEQIWSDRIRRASTWGTWGLMGMNFLLFVVLQFVAEPWRRRRLVNGVVAEEKGVLEEVRRELGVLQLAVRQVAAPAAPSSLSSSPATPMSRRDEMEEPRRQASVDIGWSTWRDTVLAPAHWRTLLGDLGSERSISLRMRDASFLVLEGAFAGVAFTAGLAWILLRRS